VIFVPTNFFRNDELVEAAVRYGRFRSREAGWAASTSATSPSSAPEPIKGA
jgi:hypothetical protein